MQKDIVLVLQKHLALGIEKYEGKIDVPLQELIDKSNYQYKVYRFNDGRILLVLPDESSGILYANQEILFQRLDLN
jgi:CRISPR/Cas system CMR-associated protein Cmr3 (group 5 of RAMP superfamily)